MSYVETCKKHGQYHADYICGACFEEASAENAMLRNALEFIARKTKDALSHEAALRALRGEWKQKS